MKERVYLTTTLPYVNAKPHLGFALELVQADIFARFQSQRGNEVFLNTGTDEHGQKILRQASELKQRPADFVDRASQAFRDLLPALGVLPETNFIRTTDINHIAAAQEFWRRCFSQGDIYKQKYRIKYCVGCELEKTDSELAGGRCSLHPNLTLEIIEEENYFFRLTKYQQPLLAFYKRCPEFVVPAARLNEVKKFVERGLQDISISRLKSKMPWGIEVPDDPEQVMYVWFDALVNYVAAVGWPADQEKFSRWWPAIQFAGKDNLRQQAAMWQAMLFSAGLPLSRQIMIHGFITVGGQKMSKSLGNVLDPLALVKEYGVDAVRYFLARHVHPFEDTDVTPEKFKEVYNAHLANGLGNLAARIMQLAEAYLPEDVNKSWGSGSRFFPKGYNRAFEDFEFGRAIDLAFSRIQELDRRIDRDRPFDLVKKNPDGGRQLILTLTRELYEAAWLLGPFMPEASEKIIKTIKANKKPPTLFPRKD